MQLDVAQSIPLNFDNEQSPFGVACFLFGGGRSVRDRFNKLNSYSYYDWVDTVDEVPEPSEYEMSDLLDERACEFIKKGTVAVQWSGGVDSTTVLLSLIKNGISKEDLIILYDSNSVQEYESLYNWLQQEGYNLQQVTRWRYSLAHIEADVITNGWCADQLFGSIFFHDAYRFYFNEIPELLRKVKFPFGYLDEDKVEEYSEIYKTAAREVLGLDLSIAAELGWYINFTMKYTWVAAHNDLYLAGTNNHKKIECFFDTSKFQSWSVNNFPRIKEANIYGKDASQYKRPFKEYCNEVFPNEEYLNQKTKVPSWMTARSSAVAERCRTVIRNGKYYDILRCSAVTPESLNKQFELFFAKYKKNPII